MSSTLKKSRHILELTTADKKELLDSFDMILSDCDGVVWLLLETIPNTGPAINLLKNAGKSYKFVSNNSMRTEQDYLQKFKEIGAENINSKDLVYPIKAIVSYINEHFPKQTCFVLGGNTFAATLRANGVNVKTMITPPDVELEDLPDLIKPSDHVAAVIVDIHVNMTFVELALAQQYLLQKDCRLIIGTPDADIPIMKNFSTLGSIGFVNILAEACDKEILLFGKPGQLLGEYLLRHFKISQPRRVLFIGDNLDIDIKFGLNMGFQTLFVLSGAHSKEGMLNKPLKSQPEYYADSMADFLPFFDDLNSK